MREGIAKTQAGKDFFAAFTQAKHTYGPKFDQAFREKVLSELMEDAEKCPVSIIAFFKAPDERYIPEGTEGSTLQDKQDTLLNMWRERIEGGEFDAKPKTPKVPKPPKKAKPEPEPEPEEDTGRFDPMEYKDDEPEELPRMTETEPDHSSDDGKKVEVYPGVWLHPGDDPDSMPNLWARKEAGDHVATRMLQEYAQELVPGLRHQDWEMVCARQFFTEEGVTEEYIEQLRKENRIRPPEEPEPTPVEEIEEEYTRKSLEIPDEPFIEEEEPTPATMAQWHNGTMEDAASQLAALIQQIAGKPTLPPSALEQMHKDVTYNSSSVSTLQDANRKLQSQVLDLQNRLSRIEAVFQAFTQQPNQG